jgi:hypothetical protein
MLAVLLLAILASGPSASIQEDEQQIAGSGKSGTETEEMQNLWSIGARDRGTTPSGRAIRRICPAD